MSVLPFFELKYTMIIARAILIYIYIISVVCYGTVKLWLWDKAVCRSSFNMWKEWKMHRMMEEVGGDGSEVTSVTGL